MNDQYQRGELNEFQIAFLANFAFKGDIRYWKLGTSEVIQAFEMWSSRRFGRQDYTTFSGKDGFRLCVQRIVQKRVCNMKQLGDVPEYSVGLNDDVIIVHAPQRFGRNMVTSNGDGTRGKQGLKRQGNRIVGFPANPDVELWLADVVYIPETSEELIDLIRIYQKLNLLSSSIHTEQFRMVTNRAQPSITYGIRPEPKEGNTAIMNLKYWFEIMSRVHHSPLRLHAFVTDMCACALCSGKMMMTPTDEMIQLGCCYLGLPVDDYKYFALYSAPGKVISKHTGYGYGVVVRALPIPIAWIPDNPHGVRLFQKNIDSLAFLPFFLVNPGDLQSAKVAHFGCLREMSAKRLGHGMMLAEICTINSYASMKNDACYSMVSQPTIALLTLHHPEDKATILSMQAMHFLCEVYRNRSFSNTVLGVEYVWRCAAVWEIQERYVKYVARVDRPSDCLPSYQFRDFIEISACSYTNFCLLYHMLVATEPSLFQWSNFNFSEFNQDEVEGTHSCGRFMRGRGLDVNFDVQEWCTANMTMQQIADSKRVLEAAGLVFGAPKHTEKTTQNAGKSLGTYECDDTHAKSAASHLPPIDFEEYRDDLIEARERGYHWARNAYVSAFGPAFEAQMDAAGQWLVRELVPGGESYLPARRLSNIGVPTSVTPDNQTATMCRVREVQELPSGMRIVSCHEPLTHDFQPTWLRTPAAPIPPSSIKIPARDKKKLADIEKRLREQSDLMSGEVTFCSNVGGDGAPANGADLLDQLKVIKTAAADYREDVQDYKDHMDKNKKKVLIVDSHGVCVFARVLTGELVRNASGEYESTDQIMARYQRAERICRDISRRFIAGRVPDFEFVIKEGHDVTLGTCMLVQWGTRTQFALVRVYKMYDSVGERTYSLKLDRKCKKAQFRVEVLTPSGCTEHGSQLYRSSGWQVGPIAGTMVLSLLQLLPMSTIRSVSRESRLHDALLPVEKIQEVASNMVQIVLAEDGFLNAPSGCELVKTKGWGACDRCYMCKLLWFDEKSGALVRCTSLGCRRVYHQECVHPIIPNSGIDTFKCSVCSGEDAELCRMCDEPYNEHEVDDRDSLDNDELVNCKGCEKWVHQACHQPAIYPLPLGDFYCCNCARPEALDPNPVVCAKRKRQPKSKPTAKLSKPSPAVPAPAQRDRRSSTCYSVGDKTLGDDELIGCKLSIYWDDDDKHYSGVVKAFDIESGTHQIAYDDGTLESEDLKEMEWSVLSAPTFRETSHLHSTRVDRVTWDRLQ